MDPATLEAAFPQLVLDAIGSPFTAVGQVYVDDRPRRSTQAAAVCWIRPDGVRARPSGIGNVAEERVYVFHFTGQSQDARTTVRGWVAKLRSYLHGGRRITVSGYRKAEVGDEVVLPFGDDPLLGPVRGLAEVEVSVSFFGIGVGVTA